MSTSPLPWELILAQLETLDVCESLFPLTGELSISSDTASSLPLLRAARDTAALDKAAQLPSELLFTINLTLTREADAEDFPLALSVSLPLLGSSEPSVDAPAAHLTLHQPPWLSRAAHVDLASTLRDLAASASGNSELVMEAIDLLREEGSKALPKEAEKEAEQELEPEWRVWFVLVSLSTREKRDDMVNWAPDYRLTGFVLAGKPALLVLEGTAKNIDAYMNDIKSRSWADIPSFQKKVSERSRTPLSAEYPRAFDSMAEITSLISRGGHRGNRGEMGEVRDFLEAKGLGEMFGEVLGQGNFS